MTVNERRVKLSLSQRLPLGQSARSFSLPIVQMMLTPQPFSHAPVAAAGVRGALCGPTGRGLSVASEGDERMFSATFDR